MYNSQGPGHTNHTHTHRQPVVDHHIHPRPTTTASHMTRHVAISYITSRAWDRVPTGDGSYMAHGHIRMPYCPVQPPDHDHGSWAGPWAMAHGTWPIVWGMAHGPQTMWRSIEIDTCGRARHIWAHVTFYNIAYIAGDMVHHRDHMVENIVYMGQ